MRYCYREVEEADSTVVDRTDTHSIDMAVAIVDSEAMPEGESVAAVTTVMDLVERSLPSVGW